MPLIVQSQCDDTRDWRNNIPLIRQKFPNAKVCYLDRAHHQLADESEDILMNIFAALDLA